MASTHYVIFCKVWNDYNYRIFLENSMQILFPFRTDVNVILPSAPKSFMGFPPKNWYLHYEIILLLKIWIRVQKLTRLLIWDRIVSGSHCLSPTRNFREEKNAYLNFIRQESILNNTPASLTEYSCSNYLQINAMMMDAPMTSET